MLSPSHWETQTTEESQGSRTRALQGKWAWHHRFTPKQSNSVPLSPYMLSSVAVKILGTKHCAKKHPELPGVKSVLLISNHLKVNCGKRTKASVKNKKRGLRVLWWSCQKDHKKMSSAMDCIWLQFFPFTPMMSAPWGDPIYPIRQYLEHCILQQVITIMQKITESKMVIPQEEAKFIFVRYCKGDFKLTGTEKHFHSLNLIKTTELTVPN